MRAQSFSTFIETSMCQAHYTKPQMNMTALDCAEYWSFYLLSVYFQQLVYVPFSCIPRDWKIGNYSARKILKMTCIRPVRGICMGFERQKGSNGHYPSFNSNSELIGIMGYEWLQRQLLACHCHWHGGCGHWDHQHFLAISWPLPWAVIF
jgi:hypothetical protein